MTTDNKTLAVDVLAVIDGLSALWRDESQIVGRWDSADELDSIRAAVAELIEAFDIAAYGEYLPESVEQQIRTSLAHVRGESA